MVFSMSTRPAPVLAALLVLAVGWGAASCSDTSVVEAGPEPPPASSGPVPEGDAESSTTTEVAATTLTTTVGTRPIDNPATEVDEAVAYQTLVDLIEALAGGDYAAASRLLVNEGVSERVLDQLALTEDQALRPGGLEPALARYCSVTDCEDDYEVTGLVEAEFLTTVWEVLVIGSNGDLATSEIPVGAFEGQYTVGALPFGSPPLGPGAGGGGEAPIVGQDGVPFYFGSASPEGWRLAPMTGGDPLLTYWNRDGFRQAGHGGLADRTPLVAAGYGPISVAVNGYGAMYFQLVGDEQTIWRDEGDGRLEAVVTVPVPQRIVLEGVHVRDLGDVDLFYQIRFGGSPQTAVDKLFRRRLPAGQETEIMVTGGWESGTVFHDLEGAYPLAVGSSFAEAASWHVILNLETGELLYDGGIEGSTCFDGEPGCPFYEVATLHDGVIYGIGPGGDDSVPAFSQALRRFNPATGAEEAVARFEWDNGLWYPHGLLSTEEGLILSVGDFEGDTAFPAVVIDPTTGLAETLVVAGFVGPAYLS